MGAAPRIRSQISLIVSEIERTTMWNHAKTEQHTRSAGAAREVVAGRQTRYHQARSRAPGVPGPSLVYLVTSLPKPERSGLARPSVCAPLRATISMSPRPMR